MINFLGICSLVVIIVSQVSGHGRMMEPPARNTMWRMGFPTKPNYEDSELFCGGIKVQWEDNKGKCGICGDAFSGHRDHETGGFYAYNYTVRSYSPGSAIDILIDIVANHGGRFKFEMCWRNSFEVKETEDCFKPLQLVNGNWGLDIDSNTGPGKRLVQVLLPREKECQKCVLRWHWKSANNWGRCDDGSHQVGCGPQETYRNCADISVGHNLGIRGSPDLRNNGIESRSRRF